MQQLMIVGLGIAVFLLVVLLVCSIMALRLLGGVAQSLGAIPALKTAMESVARTNADASATATDGLKRTIGELDRVLQDGNHQMQTRYESALRSLAQTTDRFQTTIVDHLQRLAEHEATHESTIKDALAAAQDNNAQSLAKTSDAISRHIKDLQEASSRAAAQLTDTCIQSTSRLTGIMEAFNHVVEEQAANGQVVTSRYLEVVEMTGTQMGKGVEAASKEFARLLREHEQRTQQQANAIGEKVSEVAAALVELRNSLEEAVKF